MEGIDLRVLEKRGYDTLLGYVRGDESENTLWSGIKGVPDDVLRRLLLDRRAELERIDPARTLLLTSMVPGKRP